MTMMPPIAPEPGDDMPYWWDAAKGKLWRPDDAGQEVMANGTQCGFRIRHLANLWGKAAGLAFVEVADMVKYPVDYFTAELDDEGEQIEPVKTPITNATVLHKADSHPILAWAVHPGGGTAAVVVDSLEKTDSPYGDCKMIQGTPSEVLPLEILEKMGLG
tara:strand:- start:594 stop:1073 length:480 start_codon:yes stop_codon:yes gene_type:complete